MQILSSDIVNAIKTTNTWIFPTIITHDIQTNEKQKNTILDQVIKLALERVNNENEIEITKIIAITLNFGYDTSDILDRLQDQYDIAYENSLSGDGEPISQSHCYSHYTAIKIQDKINILIKANILANETKQLQTA